MSSGDAVFVYGLLTFPEVVYAITGQRYRMQPASLVDYKSYGLSQQPGDTPSTSLNPLPWTCATWTATAGCFTARAG